MTREEEIKFLGKIIEMQSDQLRRTFAVALDPKAYRFASYSEDLIDCGAKSGAVLNEVNKLMLEEKKKRDEKLS